MHQARREGRGKGNGRRGSEGETVHYRVGSATGVRLLLCGVQAGCREEGVRTRALARTGASAMQSACERKGRASGKSDG